ncbi:MAG: arsenate reductase/protein-tyrosine-phosphatase family protein [Ignavibacteriaceae bacterium]
MDKQKVLFVCDQNSVRSQVAEAFLNYYGANKFVLEDELREKGAL